MKRWLPLLLLTLLPSHVMAQAPGFPKRVVVTGTPTLLKSGAGFLTFLYCAGTSGTDWLVFWDAASTPTPGTTPVNASFAWVNSPLSTSGGFRFSKGLYVAATLNDNGGGGAGSSQTCTFGLL